MACCFDRNKTSNFRATYYLRSTFIIIYIVISEAWDCLGD